MVKPEPVMMADEQRLNELGLKQDLDRSWGLLQNFGASFSIISVITGLTTLFEYGLLTGGPVVMFSGWLISSFFIMLVGCAMAEIVSAVPSSGGPYAFAAYLSAPRYAPVAAYTTGWFNFLGQVAVTTGIDFGLAGLISTTASVKGYEPTAAKTIAILAGVLILQGIINTLGVRSLKYWNNASIILHSAGVFSLCIAVLVKAPKLQPAKFLTYFYDGTGAEGYEGWSQRGSVAYIGVIGLLQATYTLTGYDAAAHMSEETRGAALAAPRGLIAAIGCSSLFGLLVLLSFLFSIQDYQTTIDSPYGQPVLQIFVDAVGENGAIVMMTVIMICVFHCGLFSVCSNSRMYYSFARDSGIPKWFATVDKRTQAPVKTIWLAVLLSFCLALPSLGSTVAFTAATSIATSGLYISYGIPIALGLVWPHHFQKGPFTLGILSKPIAAAAVMWVICITIFFCLPTANPVTSQTLNYCPVAIGVIALYIAVSWTFWARKYFVGPVRAVDGLQVAPADATDAYAHLEIGADNKLAEKDSPIDETEKESL